MPKPINSGTQRRTIVCGCEKVIRGVPDRLDVIFKLHQKVCPIARNQPLPSSRPFDNKTNRAATGILVNKRGNLEVSNEVVVNVHKDDKVEKLTITKLA